MTSWEPSRRGALADAVMALAAAELSLAEARRRRADAGAILDELRAVLSDPPPSPEEDLALWRPPVAAVERMLRTASAWVSGAALEVRGLRGIVEALRPASPRKWVS